MAQVDWFPKAQSQPGRSADAIENANTEGLDGKYLLLEGKTSQLMKLLKPGQRLEQLYEQIHGKGKKAYFAFSRIHPDKPARTVTKDSAGLFHYSENRTLSIGEYKRISSFPDSFSLLGVFNSALHVIGNSVPPLMMRAIVSRIGRLFFGLEEMKTRQVDYKAILDEAWQQHLAPKAKDAPTVISTFAGCGGSSLGYSMAGYRELLAVEWNDNAVATFKLNFPDVPVYHGDIHKLTVEECLRLARIKAGELDILDGSPPCQGFSTAGKRKMDDKRNQLYMQFVRLLRGLKPKVFVMENVSGLVKGKMKLVFADIMRELKASGYKVRCKLLNAMYFNVPQSRQRLIFIGVREDLGISVIHPKATSAPICALCATRGTKDTFKNPSKIRKFNLATRHLKHCFPSPTLTSNSEVPGSVAPFDEQGVRIGAERAAVIGSFPDTFSFFGNWQQKLNRIGNSVPPLFMRAIAGHIVSTISKSESL